MVRRVVLLKLKEGVATDEVLRKSYEILPKMPGVQSCRIGGPEHPSECDCDIVFFVDFQRMEDLPAYVDDPVHREYVENFLNPRVASKTVMNVRLW